MDATVVERVPMTTRVDPKVKRQFRRECRKRNVKAAHAIERAIALLLAEWRDAAKKSA
jgi:hypothetical protein